MLRNGLHIYLAFYASHPVYLKNKELPLMPLLALAIRLNSLTAYLYFIKNQLRYQAIDSRAQRSCCPLILHVLFCNCFLQLLFASNFCGYFFITVNRLLRIIVSQASALCLFQRV